MSLETLLEAAKYLEYRTQATAHGEDVQDFETFLAWSGGGGSAGDAINNNNHNKLGTFSSTSTNGNIDCLLDADSKDRRRSAGCAIRALGTREVHNKLEKNRRAHLKRCFESLKKQIPIMDEKKTSNLGILRSSLRYIQLLKRKEREYEFETERLAREKIALQQRLTSLKKELSAHPGNIDISCLLPDVVADVPASAAGAAAASTAEDTNSTSTATECGPLSDFDDDEFLDEMSMDDADKPPPTASTAAVVAVTAAGGVAPEAVTTTPAVSKVRRTTELFRLLCDPPLSAQSPQTEGPYIMYCQQTAPATKSTIVPATPLPPAGAIAVPVAVQAVHPKLTKGSAGLSSSATSVIVSGGAAMTPFQPTAFVLQPTAHKVSRSKGGGPTATLSFGPGIPSRVQVAPLSFPAQIVPQTTGLHFNGSATGILTAPMGHHHNQQHIQQPIQLLAQQTMRFISAPATAQLLNGLQANVAVANAKAPSATSKASGGPGQIKMTGAANGQNQIAIAQLAIKAPATINFRPPAAAAEIGYKGPSTSAPAPLQVATSTAVASPLAQALSQQKLMGSAGVATVKRVLSHGNGTGSSDGNNSMKAATAGRHQLPLQFLTSSAQQLGKPVVVVAAPQPQLQSPLDLATTKPDIKQEQQ